MSLRCIECGATADDDARGWRAYLIDLDDPRQDEPAFYCPVCAQREFGQDDETSYTEPLGK